MNRRQLRELGLSKPQVETLLRRRSLAAVHPGVYVHHTGTPTYAPRGRRGPEYRDTLFEGVNAHLELDGGHHDGGAQKDDDADRDLQDIASGWADTARPCSPTCEVGSESPDSPWAGRRSPVTPRPVTRR